MYICNNKIVNSWCIRLYNSSHQGKEKNFLYLDLYKILGKGPFLNNIGYICMANDNLWIKEISTPNICDEGIMCPLCFKQVSEHNKFNFTKGFMNKYFSHLQEFSNSREPLIITKNQLIDFINKFFSIDLSKLNTQQLIDIKNI